MNEGAQLYTRGVAMLHVVPLCRQFCPSFSIEQATSYRSMSVSMFMTRQPTQLVGEVGP